MIIMLLVDGIATILSLRQNHQHQVASISFEFNQESTTIFVDLSINTANANPLSGHGHSSDHFGEEHSTIDILVFILTPGLFLCSAMCHFLNYFPFSWLKSSKVRLDEQTSGSITVSFIVFRLLQRMLQCRICFTIVRSVVIAFERFSPASQEEQRGSFHPWSLRTSHPSTSEISPHPTTSHFIDVTFSSFINTSSSTIGRTSTSSYSTTCLRRQWSVSKQSSIELTIPAREDSQWIRALNIDCSLFECFLFISLLVFSPNSDHRR